jgi:subtilisin family serine protease
MLATLSVFLFLASGVSAPAVTRSAASDRPQRIIQTVHAQNDGTTKVDIRSVDAAATTLQSTEPDGRVFTATWLPEKRVLIELHARPVLDRANPGSVAEASLQREQLARNLMLLDDRLQARIPSQITREFQTLFSGAAATVDSSLIDDIRRLPNVAAVHDDFEVRASLTESVPMIGATTVASTYGVTGAGVVVAVIDTGIDYTHPDLGGCFGAGCKVVGGYDFIHNDSDPGDDHGHGTHVAGIIAANGTLKGVAPGATLLAYKVLDQYGDGYSSDIIAALEQAVSDGAQVANLSLGGQGFPEDPLSQAVDNATAAGMLSVTGAGNSGWGASYRTITSPGLSRTALTVGATDKSWQMADFSSRGYVMDGNRVLMKPEIVAPGVDILSTVPATGSKGDPTRYKILSGTSIATPHVAGSAALLLQWNAAQTPEELKNRLVNSARSIDGDVFTRGAGGIDLVAAFGTNVLASTTHVSFGAVDAASGIVVREETISVRNMGAALDTFSLTAEPTLPAGATLEIIPPSARLQPGESVDVTLRLQVDAEVVPEAPEPLAWSTSIVITSGGPAVHVPAYFFTASMLTLAFDEAPWSVFVSSESEEGAHELYEPGTSLSILLKRGLWDVGTIYDPPVAIVVREQVDLQHSLSLSIDRSEAIRTATVRAIDESEQPLPESTFSRELLLSTPHFMWSVFGPDDFRVSDLSSRFSVGLLGSGPDSSGLHHFLTSWTGQGFASDVVLPTTAPYRRLIQAATQPAGTAPASLLIMSGFVVKTAWGGSGGVGGSPMPGLSRTLHFQSTSSPGLPILPLEKTALFQGGLPWAIEGPFLHHTGDANLEVSHNAFFHLLDPSNEPEAVLGAAVERWDLDLSPYSLPLQFSNSSSSVIAFGLLTPDWSTHTSHLIRIGSNGYPTLDLYRLGALVGTYPLSSLSSGILSAEGAHQIRSATSYSIGGVSGSTHAVISFDTSKFDPNPPKVSRFRIEQYGVRTPAPFHPANQSPKVQFRVTDTWDVTSVKLESRTSSEPAWTEVPLSISGSDYDAFLTAQGSIDLRLTATDSSGNSFQEEWTPAMITTTAPPPSTPTFIAATRAAATAISISWAAGSSPLGISGYRIERLPDNATMTTTGTATTFVDSDGLVNGNAYAYRVAAIDTNEVQSTPSAYDLATLIELSDDPVVAGVTTIRGAHIADLRRAIDAIRNAAGLGSAWTNYDPPTSIVRASDFTGLRDPLNEARSILQIPAVEFSNSIAPGALIRAQDLLHLRDGVK